MHRGQNSVNPPNKVQKQVDETWHKLLANPVIENYRVEIDEI